MLINLTRQVAWLGVPRVGRPLTIDFHGTPGGHGQVWVSPGTGTLSFPFGVFRLDPVQSFPALAAAFGPQGRASVTFQIPAGPSLVEVALGCLRTFTSRPAEARGACVDPGDAAT